MRKIIGKLSIAQKFHFAIISSVILVIVILTSLIIRRESLLTRGYYMQNAEILARAISMALKYNMLSGNPDETLSLIGEMKTLDGVNELAVMKADGSYAFEGNGRTPALRISVFTQKVR